MQCPRCNHKLRLTGESKTSPHLDIEILGAASKEYDPEHHGRDRSDIPIYRCDGCGGHGSFSDLSETDEDRSRHEEVNRQFYAIVRKKIAEKNRTP